MVRRSGRPGLIGLVALIGLLGVAALLSLGSLPGELALPAGLALPGILDMTARAEGGPVSPPAGAAASQAEAQTAPPTASQVAPPTAPQTAPPAASQADAVDSLLLVVRDILEPPDGTMVLHFHATERCADCILIETYVRDLIEDQFAAQLAEGALHLRLVNIDIPENRPLLDYYRIDDTMVVLTRWHGGQELESMPLWEVWDYVEDPLSLELYVGDEVISYLERDRRPATERSGSH